MTTVSVFNVANERLRQDFEEIFREHYLLVYRTAYSVTGRPQDAEDVLQNVFLWLFRRGMPSDLRDTKAYLYRAAVNASLNIVKARQREISNSETERVALPAAASANSDHGRLVDAMAQLSPRSVEMLVLRYEHGYSDAEIARLLGTSRGVIAVTLHRARTRLRKLLSVSQKEKI